MYGGTAKKIDKQTTYPSCIPTHNQLITRPATIKILYLMFVKPIVDYGSGSPKSLGRLEPIQNRSMRIATGTFKSSLSRSLHFIYGIQPIYFGRINRMLNYFLRIHVNPQDPLNSRIISSELLDDELSND